MKNFEFFSPTHYVFGRGAENKAGDELKKLGGTYALIHYGGGSAVRSGLIERVKQSLDEAGVKYEVLGGAQPNPRAALVYKGIELCREKGIDCLLAVGDDEMIKIHFHTNEPWKVLEYCASLGEIYDIVVEDMDRQSRGLHG